MGLDNPIHIAILLLVVLLVFGAKRLPEIGRSLGEGMRGFKDSITGNSSNPERETLNAAAEHPPAPAPVPAAQPSSEPVATPPPAAPTAAPTPEAR